MNPALEEIAAVVKRECGMLLREPQLDALAAAIDRIDPSGDPESFLRRLSDPVAGPFQLARLFDEVTVKETFFLRDIDQLRQIEWHTHLARAHRRDGRKVRLWSVGCATGEEAYSLALLACESYATFEPPITILATDISGKALAAAREGSYRPRSTRELDPIIRQRYFHEAGEQLVVLERLRSLVTFARHNVVRDPVPPLGEPPFDLILCRNLLIYFDGETVDRVIAALESALAPSGTLLLGAADALCRGAGQLRALQTGVAASDPASSARRRALRRPLGRLERPPAEPGSPAAPLDATSHFLRGVTELEAGNPADAITAFRAALYGDPRFGLAAFQLGRAHEAIGNTSAARRAYEQALSSLDPTLDVHERLIDQVDLDDVKAAASLRLDVLSPAGTRTGSTAGVANSKP
jgi:chemotaxis protein methyltransferase CheR